MRLPLTRILTSASAHIRPKRPRPQRSRRVGLAHKLSFEPLETRALLNVAPVAADDLYLVTSTQTLTVDSPGVLANDLDRDGDSLTAAVADSPLHGSVTLNTNGSFDYTPDAGFRGTDVFTYFANDSTVDSTIPATVRIRVEPPRLVKDLGTIPGYGSTPMWLTECGGKVFFVAAPDYSWYPRLFVSDGTSEGTKPLLPENYALNPSYLTDVNGTLYFSAWDYDHGRELWKTDGTEAGTQLVKDIWTTPSPNPYYDENTYGDGHWSYNSSSDPQNLTNVNGTLYFTAADEIHGRELWASDGTPDGTRLVKEISPGSDPSWLGRLTNVNGTLYFIEGPSLKLWKSDGTETGTVQVADVAANILTNVNGVVYFFGDDGASGTGLWKSNGTDLGTELVKEIPQGMSFDSLANVNGTLYFSGFDPSTGPQLWKSDGTTSGTVVLKSFPDSTAAWGPSLSWPWGGSSPTAGTNGVLYFVMDDAAHGSELWSSDGTPAGTKLVKDMNPGPDGSWPYGLTDVNGIVYFGAGDGTSSSDLWQSDGTEAGTHSVPWAELLGPGWLTYVDGTLYFTGGNDTNGGRELWAITLSNVEAQGDDLLVYGSPGRDVIAVNPGVDSGTVNVVLNGVTHGPVTVAGKVLVFGLDGDDTITVNTTVPGGLIIDGGDGSDTYMVNLGGWEGAVEISDTGTSDDVLEVVGVSQDDNVFNKTTGRVTWVAEDTTETIVNFSGIDHLFLVGGSAGNQYIDPDMGPTTLKYTTIIAGPAGSVNVVQIAHTAAEVIVQDGGGQNDVTIEMGDLGAPVTVQGTTGINQVEVVAPSGTNDLMLTATQLSSDAETINLLGSSSSLAIHLGEGDTTLEIASTSTAGVTIDTQGGSESSYNYVIDMGSLAGPVAINGDTGTSQVTINAPPSETGETNTLTLTEEGLTSATETITLNLGSTLTELAVDGSAGDNQLVVEGSPPAPLALDNVAVLTHVQFGGRVFDDRDNDGVFDRADGDAGIAGVNVRLVDPAGATVATAATGADGLYAFDLNLSPGTYGLVEEQPFGLLDGQGVPGAIVVSEGDWQASGYDFAEIQPSDISGMAWEDFNNDGEVNFGEKVIDSAVITLTGTDDRGNPVGRTVSTDADGMYMFIDLRPSDANGYTITETQPEGFVDGKDTVGTVNGVETGDKSVNDVFSGVVLRDPGSVGQNYNFGERPPTGGAVTAGQTATVGFWQNKNGQALLRSLPVFENADGSTTSLGHWLAATFPNMYGSLANATDNDVASFYTGVFLRTKKEAMKLGLTGPVKMDAQVMAVAFACYVTNETLAGTTAASYGFLVTENGVGTSTFNVGTGGQAFGIADQSQVAILDLLFATNDRSWNGVLYDLDHDGTSDDTVLGLSETLLRTLANDVYSAINEAGHI